MDFSDYGGIAVDAVIITPFDILFNRIPLVDVNFFNFDGLTDGSTILIFRKAIAGWYYTLRLIACMALLVILVYIGIRMALSSIATEKALYKKMLVDWATSLALLFLLHYIMLFVFSINNALVNAMEKIAEGTTISGTSFITTSYGALMTTIQGLMFDIDIIVRVAALIIYGMLVFQTISFLIAYIKRMFTIGFLIAIAPLITITYSMDKIGDGKAQALNTWLKEFVYNILLQPFQCILYLIFTNITFSAMLSTGYSNFNEGNVGIAIFAILSLQFIKEGEKLIKKIFGFDKASTAGDLAVGAALTAGAVLKGGDVAKKAGGAIMKTKNMMAQSRAVQNARDRHQDRKIDRLAKKLQKDDEKKNSKSSNKESNKESKKETKENKNTSTENKKDTNKENQEEKNQKLNREIKPEFREKAIQQMKEEKDRKAAEKAKKKANNPKTKDTNGADGTENSEGKEKKKGALRKIGGAVGGVGKEAKAFSGDAIKGLRGLVKDNKKKIAGFTIGMVGAGIGLGASDFGDFTKGVAGYNMGKGFTEGIYANSSKELKKQSEASSQLYANMTGDNSASSQLATVDLADKNDLKKDLKDAQKSLEKILKKYMDPSAIAQVMGQFNRDAMDNKVAGTITGANIADRLNDAGFSPTGNMNEAVDAFKKYGSLIAAQSLASNIRSAEGMGIDRESLARIIGDRAPVNGNGSPTETVEEVTETSTYEEKFKEMDISAIARELANQMGNGSGSTNVEVNGLNEVNSKINELNALLNTLSSKNDETRNAIINEISKNNSNIKTFEDVVDNLHGQIDSLNSKKSELE